MQQIYLKMEDRVVFKKSFAKELILYRMRCYDSPDYASITHQGRTKEGHSLVLLLPIPWILL